MERCARAGVRRRRRLEAVGEDAAVRASAAHALLRAALAASTRRCAGRCRSSSSASARAATRWSTIRDVALDQRDRSTAHGPRGRPRRGARASARTSSNWAATTRRSSRPSADLDLAMRAIVFAAVGTAGQRCTTLRRLIVHESIYDDARRRGSRRAYAQLPHRRSAASRTRWWAR